MADFAGPAALAVPPGNAGALAWALNRILTDAALADRLRREGPKSAAPYTWEASARLHLDAYRLAVQGGGGGTVMKALVTGAGGFVGQTLVAHLEAAGDEVVGLDRAGGPDITDSAAVREAVARHRPEAVYHLAAVTHIGASWDAPLEVVPDQRRRDAQRPGGLSAAGVGRVLVVGSADEYGAVRPEDLPLTEEAPAASSHPVRRQQGGRRVPRPPGLPRATGCPSCGCGPSTTAAGTSPTGS